MPKVFNPLACSYCPTSVGYTTGVLCAFHADWECACNLVEDLCEGSIPDGLVVARMIEWGWTQAGIDAALALEESFDRQRSHDAEMVEADERDLDPDLTREAFEEMQAEGDLIAREESWTIEGYLRGVR